MQKFQQWMKRFGVILVLIGIVCSAFVGYERIQTENQYKNISLSVNELDVKALANANQKTSEEMLSELKKRGVRQILFKEESLGGLANSGEILLAKGENVNYLPVADQLPSDLPRDRMLNYVVITNQKWKAQIVREVTAKIPSAKVYDGSLPVVTIPLGADASISSTPSTKLVVEELGVGFDQAWMKTVADNGFGIIAQVRSWMDPTPDALELLGEDLKAVPNLEMILFNNKYIPGYPNDIKTLYYALLGDDDKPIAPIGQIEFNNQKGFNKLAVLMNKEVVRLHTISNSEMSKYEGDGGEQISKGEKDALDRWDLAARERNMRSLLVRFFSSDMPSLNYDTNMAYLESIQKNLLDDGFVLDKPLQSLKMPVIPDMIRLLIGIGICAGVMLLLLKLRFSKLAPVIFVLSCMAWIGLYYTQPNLAEQIMALVSVITFPILSCITFLPLKRQPKVYEVILKLLQICLMSYIGAILVVGVLSDTAFMLKLSQFLGVKIAHIIPILVVPLTLYIWYDEKPLAKCRSIADKALEYKWAVLFGILAVALMIYVSRTGNDGMEISSTEQMMRQFLTDFLGVRPRSKEFLIGYPLTFLYLYYGKDRPFLWFLTIPLVIGQVSLVNTYAHIHTPLLISIERSLNGLLLGVILGLLLLLVVQIALKLWHSYSRKMLQK